MAVRCSGCGRLTRGEVTCEWCGADIAAAPRPAAAPDLEAEKGGAVKPTSQATGVAGASAGRGEAADDTLLESQEGDGAIVEELAPAGPWYRDNFTLTILLLILVQFALTLYLGRLATWWSITGFLWLLVGYGVVARLSWSLALPLVLFTLDVALLLINIGPREGAGLFSVGPMVFLLYLLRLGIWALIWPLREEMD
jgi:hypothetical protein